MAKSQSSGNGKDSLVPFPGPGMIILNIIRGCSIISLLTAITASWALIIKMNMARNFFVFDAASLFFTSSIALFLVISELQLWRDFFTEYWPCLGDDSGFVWLGLAMTVIGSNILGKLNLPANDAKEIGLPWWRLVLAGGIITITFGIFNIICSFIWWNRKMEINARMVRDQGKLVESPVQLPLDKTFYSTKTAESSLRNEKTKSKFMSMFWKKDGANDEKGSASTNKKSPKRKLEISAPIQQSPNPYANSPNPNSNSPQPQNQWANHQSPNGDHLENGHHNAGDGDSYPHVNTSPIVPGVQRPDSALHPWRRQPSISASSIYSTTHYSRMPV